MKYLQVLSLISATIFYGCQPANKAENKTEMKEPAVSQENEWIALFDGSSLDQWTSWESSEAPGVWSITENRELFCRALAKDDAKPGEKGVIVTKDQFEDFHLKLEWKISPGGNSGVFYLGSKDYESIVDSAPEMQVLDNDGHADGKKGKDGNRKSGSLYDLIPAVPQNAKPIGEWNTAEVIVKDRHLIHKMNGETVVEVDLDTEEWKELVSGSKFPKIREDWYQVPQKGFIALQDHNNDVWFRKIMIKEL